MANSLHLACLSILRPKPGQLLKQAVIRMSDVVKVSVPFAAFFGLLLLHLIIVEKRIQTESNCCFLAPVNRNTCRPI